MIAADMMTENPRTVRASDPVGDALDALQSLEVRHLPVVDDENNLVGMLSDRDLGSLMRVFTEGEGGQRLIVPLARQLVSDLMSADVLTVNPDADVVEVIEMMLEQRVGAVPVVDGEGGIVGIISYVDVLRSVAEELQADAAPQPRPRVERH